MSVVRRKEIKIAIAAAIGIVLLVVWLRVIDLDATLSVLRETRLEYAVLFTIVFLVSYFIRSQRWRIIIGPVGRINLLEAYSLYMSGVALNFLLPVRAGEVAKSVLLRNMNGMPMSRSMATIIVDRPLDMSPTILLLAALPFLPLPIEANILTIAISVAIALALFFGGIVAIVVRKRQREKPITPGPLE